MSALLNNLDNQYEAIPFSLQEYAFMEELFKSAFNSKLTREVFLKRFDTSALGCEVIGFIAKHKASSSPAAYYGVFPVKIQLNGKEILAAQSGDTMTHENHRKKGLFIWLAKMTFSKCLEKGIDLVFGLPNKNSYPGFIKHLQWQHIDNVAAYDLKLKIKTIPLAKIFLKMKLFGFYRKLVKMFLARIVLKTVDGFTQSYPEGSGKVIRDKNYLIYKESNQKVFLQFNKAVAWINFTDVLWIGDFTDYSLVDDDVLRKLKRLCIFLGYNTIRFNLNSSLQLPGFLHHFKKQEQEPLCFLYLNKELQGSNLILTAADFDTW